MPKPDPKGTSDHEWQYYDGMKHKQCTKCRQCRPADWPDAGCSVTKPWENRTAADGLVTAVEEIDRLNAECSALAANQCHKGYGTEYGDHRCKYQDEIAALRTALKALVGKLDECLPHINNSFAFAHVHGQRYSGPAFGGELEAARKVLNEP